MGPKKNKTQDSFRNKNVTILIEVTVNMVTMFVLMQIALMTNVLQDTPTHASMVPDATSIRKINVTILM